MDQALTSIGLETGLPDTRSRILNAAERLFAEHGFEATSMRMITRDAGVNLAAVNYHFGAKEALVHEVFRRRLTWLNQRRLAALDRFERDAGPNGPKASHILEAFFGTALEMAADDAGGGRTFMQLLGRTYSEPAGFVRKFLADEYAAVLDRFKQALCRALPDVPREEILWRFHFMLDAMAYAISGIDTLKLLADVDVDDPNTHERMVARLMSFLLGGLRAPLPDAVAKSAEATQRRSA